MEKVLEKNQTSLDQSPLLVFDQVTLGYDKERPLLEKASFSIMRHGFYFLTGKSGTGKTSLFKALLMTLEPFYGSVELFGKKTRGLSTKEKTALRQKIGIVFQDYKLLSHLSVEENIALPLLMRGCSLPKALKQANDLLTWLEVRCHPQEKPQNISGGEKQRVAIARAIISRPQLLLADEPTGNIHDESAFKITCLLERFHKLGTTVIMATHNKALTKSFPYPVITLRNQSLQFETPPSPRMKAVGEK